MSNASAQVRMDLTAIHDSVACFGSGRQAEYCAILEVAGSQQSLAKVDEAKREELLAAYAQFLYSLTFPVQLVVQVLPVDLAWYVARVEERARFLSSALVAIARDHAAFVQGLTRQRTLLERVADDAKLQFAVVRCAERSPVGVRHPQRARRQVTSVGRVFVSQT